MLAEEQGVRIVKEEVIAARGRERRRAESPVDGDGEEQTSICVPSGDSASCDSLDNNMIMTWISHGSPVPGAACVLGAAKIWSRRPASGGGASGRVGRTPGCCLRI